MSKNTQKTQRAYMHKIIPYRYCYEEGGLIETEQGLFTRTYEVIPSGEEVKGSYNSTNSKFHMLKGLG